MSTKEITKALAEFMKEVPSLSTLSTAKIQTNNGKGFEFEFVELGYICSVINPVLAKNGLHIYHYDEVIDGQEYLLSTIYHTSGESLPTSRKLIPKGINKNTLYEYGSAKTYFRRYVTLGMLNLWHGVDDAGYAYEPREENNNVNQFTNTTHDEKQNNNNTFLLKEDKEKWLEEITKLFNEDRAKFDGFSNAFKTHFNVNVVSDAITQQKHIEFFLNYLHKKEVAK
nr:ERF family protein [uncultured Mediterranean phage uvMED]BAR26464.1 ERF family protein [uncultured Mediterranean phage uvMED]